VVGHGTLNIHYVHQKSAVPDALPLLFVHGCVFVFCGEFWLRTPCFFCRARKFPGGSENTAITGRVFSGSSQFPCSGSGSTWLWVF
jgi:hypothetical protein